MRRQQVCPHCKGKGHSDCFWDGTDPKTGKRTGGYGRFKCRTCEGVGKVDAEKAQAITRGREMRDNRVARKVSLREEARRLGISAVELNEIERGVK